MKTAFAFVMLLFFATPALSGDWQMYQTEGESHYQEGSFELKSWGPGFLMRAVLEKGDRTFPVEAYLEPEDDAYRGSGYIISAFDTGKVCEHRFGVKIYFTDDGLFLRENTPEYIPDYPYGACTAAGPYEWFNHPDAYLPVDASE